MKRFMLAAVLILLSTATVFASNSVEVNGDPQRDGFLMINVDWNIDTAKYKGLSQDEIHERVYQDVWKVTRPKLVKATEGYAVSFEKSNFQKTWEEKRVIEQRPDGTKLISYKSSVKFLCPKGEAASETKQSSSDRDDSFEKQYHYQFVREGRD